MPLTVGELEDIRSEAFADDVDIPSEAYSWTAAQAERFFQSGGKDRPPSPAARVRVQRPLVRPARILCLHGGGGNAKVNQMQTARLTRALGGTDAVKCDYINGTRIWNDADVVSYWIKLGPLSHS